MAPVRAGAEGRKVKHFNGAPILVPKISRPALAPVLLALEKNQLLCQLRRSEQ
ncbi:hypothetical protein YC2023_056008 [Brassica napus]